MQHRPYLFLPLSIYIFSILFNITMCAVVPRGQLLRDDAKELTKNNEHHHDVDWPLALMLFSDCGETLRVLVSSTTTGGVNEQDGNKPGHITVLYVVKISEAEGGKKMKILAPHTKHEEPLRTTKYFLFSHLAAFRSKTKHGQTFQTFRKTHTVK